MGKTILVVDDEKDVLAYLTVVLENADYTVYGADNITDAMKLFERVRPDLVCLDIMMPRESGMSMYTKLKGDTRYRSTPVLIVSGVVQAGQFDFQEYVPDRSIPPPEEYMEKPIDVDRFLDTVRRLVNSAPKVRKKRPSTHAKNQG
jgi:DNA-binding NtrC family response regulator